MLHRIKKLIAEGEGERLDFKQSITDATKIAKTLVAFANNRGGTLLVGVRDNKTVSGIRSEDEIYMLELAGSFHCKPEIRVEIVEHEDADGKTIIEAIIPEGIKKPYYAKDEKGQWWVYLRVMDKSMLASPIALQVMKRRHADVSAVTEYTDLDRQIIHNIQVKEKLTLQELQKDIPARRNKIIGSLVNLISYGIINPVYIEKHEFYTLNTSI